MDNIIILKGTNVVINKDVYAYKTLVAKKGLKVVCEKDIKKEIRRPRCRMKVVWRSIYQLIIY